MNNMWRSLLEFFGIAPAISPMADDYKPIMRFAPQAPSPTPSPSPMPTATPTPTPVPIRETVTPEQIQMGISRFGERAGETPPIATLTGQLANVGNNLPGKADPLLPVVIALMESRGLLDPKPRAAANPYNIIPPGGLADYNGRPDVAISGGEAGGIVRQGLAGLLRSGGIYNDYLESGNLQDFFQHWSPPGPEHGNPSMDELLNRYDSLRSTFY